MKKILARITHKETGMGVSNLLVVAYDADNELERVLQTENPPVPELAAALSTSKRIGSMLTNDNGAVELSLNDGDLSTPGKIPPVGDSVGGAGKQKQVGTQSAQSGEKSSRQNLVVVVLAPEGAKRTLESRLLYVSKEVRKNAGAVETYNIELTTEELQNAQVPVPDIPSTKGNPEAEESVRKDFELRLNQVFRNKFQAEHDKVKEFDTKFKETISKVRKNGKNVLGEDEDLDEKQKKLIDEKVEEINKEPVNAEGVILLTAAQKELLAPYISEDGSYYKDVPDSIIDPILYPAGDDKKKPTFLLRNNPVADYCRQKTTEELCSEEFLQDGNGADEIVPEEDPGTNGETSLTSEDIPKYLNNLISLQTAPEERVYFGKVQTSRRPTQKDIQDSINSFILEKGPADAVSFYDFHSLQIAFEHIWMEAIDKEVLDLARNAYSRIVDLIGVDASKVGPTHVQETMVMIDQIIKEVQNKPLPATVVAQFEITQSQWNDLPYPLQGKLEEIADKLDKPQTEIQISIGPINTRRVVKMTDKEIFRLQQQGERIVDFIEGDSYRSLHKILRDLNKQLKEKYAFTLFPVKKDGKRSINFGTIVTYRQKWEPLNYQAGELVKTITLAPKEERKFSHKTVIKRKRSEKELEKHSSTRREELNTTSRSEAEIVRKAMTKTNFSLSSEGSYDLFLSEGTHKTGFTRDVQNDSKETKKDFREAVRKATQEYKSERSMEINTEEIFETEMTESGTITNPNDELAVTYMFYELQRRFRISEEIHRLTPIMLVAQEVPAPHEIDEDWLIRQDWILRRVILDDSFVPALNYLSTNIVGDEYALKELKKNLALQRQLVVELKQEAVELQEQVDHRYQALESAVQERLQVEENEETDGWFTDIGEFFGIGDNEAPEAAKAREQAAQDAHEHAVAQAKERASKLQREITALNASSEKYTKQLSRHLNRKTQIERLKVHIKDNILYYMQAIWSHEPPDQRFFRLYDTKVPHFEVDQKSYTIAVNTSENIWTGIEDEGPTAHKFQLNTNLQAQLSYKQLIEVADVDNLLGFKGNYMIFPLKEPNALTESMMAPFVDVAFGLRDPDEFGNMNLRDFSKFICCLHEEMTEDQFTAIKPVLKEYYKYLLTSPLRNGEDMIVASGSLFIEALPAKHSLLEDFKLMHRAIDVKKVQAEVREMELENIRLAARLIEGEREDPDIEKKIVIEGNSLQPVLNVGEESAMGDGQEATSINVADEE